MALSNPFPSIVHRRLLGVVLASLIAASAGSASAQPAAGGAAGGVGLLPSGLVAVSDAGGAASAGSAAESPRSLGVVDLASPASVGEVVAAMSFGRVRDAENEFQRLVAEGGLSRVVIRADSGRSGSATEIWARYMDGVRVLGASVRRVVSAGRVVDVQGFVPAAGSRVSAYRLWPGDVSAADAGASLSGVLGGVRVFPEIGRDGHPVRVWVPGFTVDVLSPAFVFFTEDGRLIAADAETGVPLLEQDTVMVFDPGPVPDSSGVFGSADLFDVGGPRPGVRAGAAVAGGGTALPDVLAGLTERNGLTGRLSAAGAGLAAQSATAPAAPWEILDFAQLRGRDVLQARTIGYGSGLRLEPLILQMFDPGAVGLRGDPLLLDLFDPRIGYQATFDARRVASSVADRCAFAGRFFLPREHPEAYGRVGGARLEHLAAVPGGVLGGRNLEDRTIAEAHGLMSYSRRYYRDLIGWRGIDNAGGPTPVLVNVVPYGGDPDYTCPWLSAFYSNAFFAFSGGPWGGGGFGFGTWQPTARSLASAVDVIGHEFVHAIALHGRRNVFGTALGYGPQQVYVRLEPSPGRVTQYGSEIACGAAIQRDVLADMRSLSGELFGYPHIPLFPYCTDEFPYQLVVGMTADASEGVSDVGGVGAEFALASHGVIDPDYRMGEDLDGFGIRNLETTAGGFSHFDDLRRSLLVMRHPGQGCRGLVGIVTLHRVPPHLSHGLCALSSIGMFGSRSGDMDIRRPLPPHPIGVVLGHAFYLAIEGGAGVSGGGVVLGAGRDRVHDLVGAFLWATAYTQPESFSLPSMAWAVLGRIDERFGVDDPLWHAFAAAAISTGILFR